MAKEYGTVLGTSLGKIPEELWDMPRSIFTMSLIKKTACSAFKISYSIGLPETC